MDFEKMCKLIEGIIENEYNNICEFKEMEFSESDKEQKDLYDKSRKLYCELNMTLREEQKEIVAKLEGATTEEWSNLCKFYFREGLKAGLSNLSFLNNVDNAICHIK